MTQKIRDRIKKMVKSPDWYDDDWNTWLCTTIEKLLDVVDKSTSNNGESMSTKMARKALKEWGEK